MPIIKSFPPFLKAILREQLRKIRRNSSDRALSKQLRLLLHRHLFEGENLSQHYGDQPLDDVGLQSVTKTFILERIRFIEECLSREVILAGKFADVGDSSGIFLKALGKPGVSVNISLPPLLNIQRKGIQTVQANIEFLPLLDGSVDHVLCFEVIEHAPNPILALRELRRVCSTNVFVSIPHVTKTRVYPAAYDSTRPQGELHIFEPSHEDFTHLLSHTGLKLKSWHVVRVLIPEGGYEKLAFGLWSCFFNRDIFYGVLRKFSVYHLCKA